MALYASLVDVGTSVATYAKFSDVVISYAVLVKGNIIYSISRSWYTIRFISGCGNVTGGGRNTC